MPLAIIIYLMISDSEHLMYQLYVFFGKPCLFSSFAHFLIRWVFVFVFFAIELYVLYI